MAKKVVSLTLHKKKHFKNSSKRKFLKSVFKKFLSYMKSDTYMFAPLASPQSYLTFAPPSFGEVSRDPIKKEEKKLVQDVANYLKCDCYMYAPLVTESAYDTAHLQTGVKVKFNGICDQMEPRTEETVRQEGKILNSSRNIHEYVADDSHNPTKRIVVQHKMLQKATVKHTVHHNCRPSSVQGEVSSQKANRI